MDMAVPPTSTPIPMPQRPGPGAAVGRPGDPPDDLAHHLSGWRWRSWCCRCCRHGGLISTLVIALSALPWTRRSPGAHPSRVVAGARVGDHVPRRRGVRGAADHGPDPRPGAGRRAGRVAHSGVDRGDRADVRVTISRGRLISVTRSTRRSAPGCRTRPAGAGDRQWHGRHGVPVPDHRHVHPVLRRRRTQDPPRPARAHAPGAQQRIGWAWDTAIEQTGGYFYPAGPAPDQRDPVLLRDGGRGGAVAGRLPLAVFGFFAEFIPVVGTYIGVAIPALVTRRGGVAGPPCWWPGPWSSSRSRLLAQPEAQRPDDRDNGGVAFGSGWPVARSPADGRAHGHAGHRPSHLVREELRAPLPPGLPIGLRPDETDTSVHGAEIALRGTR